MNKAIFLDRDGVLNTEKGDYITNLNDFELLPHIFPALKKAQSHGYQLIVITNQGGIAKGLYSDATLNQMHHFMLKRFEEEGISNVVIYYCPHHPLTGKCLCRKPGSLLVEKAIARYRISPEHSFFIGDRERDIEAATQAGVKGYLIPSNSDWGPIVDAHLAV